ncbi:hypothetical protein GCM10007385_40470 [Tateyamaria omphalii]|uniref:tripartite tricarboxylate transporter TctB family protein n=1 Tax=Tateyamaria omphalii TaxID=299262 RepID=UPI00167777DA|nr:tripartite tricarboxylate transporter TctB family protein [Tateyamaria omphalii]GGX67286.1 hypothetical protein GCM10007385_40470 [Tateyamaria omphalii]
MSRMTAQWRLILVAMLGIGLGTLAILQTSHMSELGRVFPMTASLIAIAAGLGVLLQALLRSSSGVPATEHVDYLRAALLGAVLLIWAASLQRLGFELTSGIAVVLIAMIARRDPMSVSSIVLHAFAGVLLVLGFAFLLSEVLNVRLP